jgi:hypothetical protein
MALPRRWILPICCLFLLAAAAFFGIRSHNLVETLGPKESPFWADLYLNLVPEFIGVALGILIPLSILAWYADKQLEELVTPVLRLIKRLRVEKKISPEVARYATACAVKIISEEHFGGKVIDTSPIPSEINCDVCSMKVLKQPPRCKYCNLKRHVWRSIGEPEEMEGAD